MDVDNDHVNADEQDDVGLVNNKGPKYHDNLSQTNALEVNGRIVLEPRMQKKELNTNFTQHASRTPHAGHAHRRNPKFGWLT